MTGFKLILSFVFFAAFYGSAMAVPEEIALIAPGSGTVRALIIGIDQYRHVVPLKGAVADAHDIDNSLRKMGSSDVTALIDGAASRAAVLHALDSLLDRTQRGDLVILSLAGHGAKEPEHVKGSSPDGNDEVFLLVDFDFKTASGGTEKILNHEFNHYIRAFEERGAQVIFIADACYGGGLAREITPGSAEQSYRQVPRYRLVQDDFKPVSSQSDAFLTELDFQHTTFLAAVDSETKAPEVIIDGAYRGALSYAMARAFEGAADEKGDGDVTTRELLAYTRRVVYQLSDERQNIAAPISPTRSIDTEVVLKLKSARALRNKNMAQSAPQMPPLRLATNSYRHDALNGVEKLLTPFVIVGPDEDADVVWDAANKEAIVAGDKVALDVDRDDLGGVVDRTAAVRDIKNLVVKSPQAISVLPDASLHHAGSRIEVELTDLGNRSLILVDVSGSGVIQLIYPTVKDQTVSDHNSFRVPFRVRDPYGADEVVAISSSQPQPALISALRDMDGRKDAGKLAEAIAKYAPPDKRVGLVGLFTVP